MGNKLKLSPAEITEMNRQQNLQRVINGTHHLLGGKIQKKSSAERSKQGTLGFQNPENLLKANTKRDEVVSQRIASGTWHLQSTEFHRTHVKNQIANGKHCSQRIIACLHCNKSMDSANYAKSHGDKCTMFTGLVKRGKKHPPRERLTCEVCQKTMDVSNFKKYGHGPGCVKS